MQYCFAFTILHIFKPFRNLFAVKQHSSHNCKCVFGDQRARGTKVSYLSIDILQPSKRLMLESSSMRYFVQLLVLVRYLPYSWFTSSGFAPYGKMKYLYGISERRWYNKPYLADLLGLYCIIHILSL